MLPRKPLVLKRTAPGSYVKGIWVNGMVSYSSVKCSVQPVRGAEMQAMRDNEDIESAYKLFGNDVLNTVDIENSAIADVVVIGNLEYTVWRAGDWQNRVRSHYKTIVVRKKAGAANE